MSELRLLSAPRSASCVGSGFIALDFIQVVGEETSDYVATGGSCGNVLTILSWLGWNSFPVGRLGADDAYRFIVDDLQRFKVHTEHLISDNAVQTPMVIHRITHSKGKHPTHRFLLACPECGAWLPRYRPILLNQVDHAKLTVSKPKVFYFDRMAPGVLRLARNMKEAGALVVFEPSSISDETHFRTALGICDVLKFSNERLGHFSDLKTARGPSLVVETLGTRGLKFRWRESWTTLPAFDAPNLRDAAGAGDWSSAGFIHAIAQHGAEKFSKSTKGQITHALRLGQALAAINCQFDGARGAMYELSRRQLDQHLSKHPLGSAITELERKGQTSTPKQSAQICLLCGDKVRIRNSKRKSA